MKMYVRSLSIDYKPLEQFLQKTHYHRSKVVTTLHDSSQTVNKG